MLHVKGEAGEDGLHSAEEPSVLSVGEVESRGGCLFISSYSCTSVLGGGRALFEFLDVLP